MRGVGGVLYQKILGLNGLELCNSRHHKHGIALSKTPEMLNWFLWWSGKRKWKERMTIVYYVSLEVIRIFQILTMYWRAKRKIWLQKSKNNVSIPSPTHQTSTLDPTSDKSQGGVQTTPSNILVTSNLDYIIVTSNWDINLTSNSKYKNHKDRKVIVEARLKWDKCGIQKYRDTIKQELDIIKLEKNSGSAHICTERISNLHAAIKKQIIKLSQNGD